ncbi:unnamed protein product [Mytilus coruscus]|uniref:DUF6589 domain-containing protein n=1 Tax=Mytilus coruscus TaxID=42192 RepID=A0A6J8E9G3_MYTCO|nr:unnamed protein product [Mytilus coruscus]
MGMAYSAKELTVFPEAKLISVVSNSLISIHRLPCTSLPELNTKDPVNITSGVKRSFCSDHAYCTMTCNSFNELVTDNQNAPDSDDDVDSEDDDIDNGVKSVLDAVKGVPLGDISPEFFIPNKAEKSKLRDVKKVLIGRMIVDKKDFDWLEKKLPTHIPHRYSEYMSKKQEVFSLPIIFKNESKNEDCLDIMDAYERQLTEIFTLAHGNTDMLQKHGAVLGGDQLTKERLQNVKNIRFLALTPKGRFEHLNPIVIEHWHVKQDLLSKAYKALYRAESICIPGTLFHAKTILRRQDVTGNVKSNYKAHEDLFLLMVKALLHFASDQIQVQDNEDRD